MNLSFQGGNAQQIDVISKSHQKAIEMAKQAQQCAAQRDDMFIRIFGNSSEIAVSTQYSAIVQNLSTGKFLFKLDHMLIDQVENEITYCINELSNNLRTILPWKGLFLQGNVDQVQIQSALSLIFITTENDNYNDLFFVNDMESVLFLAKYNPKMAIKSPRCYMYYARACLKKN
jgi:hypothetical protein